MFIPSIDDVIATDFTDIDAKILDGELSEITGVKRHSEATERVEQVGLVEGFVYGRKSRLIFPCVVSLGGMSRWVFFVVATGFPQTYLSSKVSTITFIILL
jgi:hypothetical protein